MKKTLLMAFALLMMLAGCSKDSVSPDIPEIPDAKKTLTLADKEEIRKILLEFYEATGGPNWIRQPNWKTEENMLNWTFFEIDGNQIIFYPSENNLTGSLPESIFRLPLYVFDVENNMLSGQLPENIGQSGNIGYMQLVNNNFTGNLPVSLAANAEIILNVEGNQLSGKLDPKFKECIYFQNFGLEQQEGYGLTGTEALQPNQQEVEILLKIQDSFVGMDLPGWTLESNPLEWENVEWNGNGRVAYLCLWQYSTGGKGLPAEINQLTELRHLEIDGMRMNQIPDLGQLTKMERLWIDGNDLQGTFPEWIFKMKNLKGLYMNECCLSGPIPERLNELTQLERLNIGSNSWTGKIPDFSRLTRLTYFGCEDCTTLDEQPLPEWLGDLPLERLYMGNCNFTGKVPESWKKMKTLQRLYLDNNQLSGDIQHCFENLPVLQKIKMGGNGFTGQLPEFTSPIIYYISLKNNELSGPIPQSWANFISEFESCYMYDNNITGNIPEFFADAVELSDVDLTGNKMSGEIPESVKQNENFNWWNLMPQQEGYGFTNLVQNAAPTKAADREDDDDDIRLEKEKGLADLRASGLIR